MTTNYTTRNKASTSYSRRKKPMSNVYSLADVDAVLLSDKDGYTFQVYGDMYEGDTYYSLRNKP